VNIHTIPTAGRSRRAIFFSIILISIGVVLMNLQSIPTAGIVLIANGGLFFIIGMQIRKNELFADTD